MFSLLQAIAFVAAFDFEELDDVFIDEQDSLAIYDSISPFHRFLKGGKGNKKCRISDMTDEEKEKALSRLQKKFPDSSCGDLECFWEERKAAKTPKTDAERVAKIEQKFADKGKDLPDCWVGADADKLACLHGEMVSKCQANEDIDLPSDFNSLEERLQRCYCKRGSKGKSDRGGNVGRGGNGGRGNGGRGNNQNGNNQNGSTQQDFFNYVAPAQEQPKENHGDHSGSAKLGLALLAVFA